MRSHSLLSVSRLFVLGACSSSLLLAGCASGGGSPGGGVTTPPTNIVTPPAAPPVPFTEWSVVGKSGNVILTGNSRETIYGTSSVAPGRFEITSLAAPGGFVPGITLIVEGTPTGGGFSVVRSGSGSVAAGYSEVAARDARLVILTDPWAPGDFAWLGNPTALGLNYQSFGTWIEYGSAGAVRLGVFTAGVPSSADSVPATGTATYRGFAAGTYVDTNAHIVTATVTATADFAKASIALSLTDSVVLQDRQGAGLPNPNLDLSGTLTFAAGANALSGPVATMGGAAGNAPMTGSANAVFYGPGAAELGGVFWVNGPGVASYSGGFGAKR